MSVCFIYVGALVLSAYMYLKLSYFPIQLNLLTLRNELLFFVTTFDVKAILSDISIATPTLLWLTSAWNFHPRPLPYPGFF